MRLEEDAEKDGHKWRTVQRAATDLEIVKQRSVFGGGTLWYLPGQQPRQDEPAAPCQDPQGAENLASWRDCENKGETPILDLGGDSPAKMPSSPGSRDTRPSAKPKAKPKPLFDDLPCGLPD